MARHNRMRIATLATIGGCATALFGPIALGQPDPTWTQVPPPSLLQLQLQFPGTRTWVGAASCNVTATSHETHTWTIIPWVVYTDSNKGTVSWMVCAQSANGLAARASMLAIPPSEIFRPNRPSSISARRA
jgi:hypothetical protein